MVEVVEVVEVVVEEVVVVVDVVEVVVVVVDVVVVDVVVVDVVVDVVVVVVDVVPTEAVEPATLHRFPVNPLRQTHENPPYAPKSHTPPFRQGHVAAVVAAPPLHSPRLHKLV